jgi:rhodanese-related sulfurtransferase
MTETTPRLALQITVLLLLGAAAAGATAFWHPRAPSRAPAAPDGADVLAPGFIRADDALAFARRENPLWIDARSADEFLRGHVPGALRLNEDEWEKRLEAVIDVWTPERLVFVYCAGRGCAASQGVAARLRRELGADERTILVVREGWEGLRP